MTAILIQSSQNASLYNQNGALPSAAADGNAFTANRAKIAMYRVSTTIPDEDEEAVFESTQRYTFTPGQSKTSKNYNFRLFENNKTVAQLKEEYQNSQALREEVNLEYSRLMMV